MKIKELKNIKASIKNFLHSKKKIGFVSYSFLEMCNLAGYEEACRVARGYAINDQHGFCNLVCDYAEIHKSGEGYIFRIKLSSDRLNHDFTLSTNMDGNLDEERDGCVTLNKFIEAKRLEGFRVDFKRKFKTAKEK